jgi:regulator of protease activity HflC (stomatin/prohibitin superfamily)
MLGLNYIKVSPTSYLIQYKDGKIVKEGAGVSFFYFAPTTTIVLVPINSVDLPFIFQEVTSDFQNITVQGKITYKVSDPKLLASLLDFSINAHEQYLSEDPQKLSNRIINQIQVFTRDEIQKLDLQAALISSESIVEHVNTAVAASNELNSIGISILSFSILAIKPNSETQRALEAQAREELLKKADDAIYQRRNASIDQERAIKENELNTQIAVENKQRQIQETQIKTQQIIFAQEHELKESKLQSQITLEAKNSELINLAVENSKKEADSKAYGVEAMIKVLKEVDPKTLQALTNANLSPEQLISVAFQDIATNSEKIGQLNISPDLLTEIMNRS